MLALKNALRYFPAKFHAELAPEFAQELKDYGRIYMYRFRPSYDMYARPIDEYPCRSRQAAAIMAMIQNNLDPRVAQHPHELIIYGGNGAIFQKLGAVPADDEVLGRDDRRADTLDVLRPSDGTLPEPQGRSEGRSDQRNGHPELFEAG